MRLSRIAERTAGFTVDGTIRIADIRCTRLASGSRRGNILAVAEYLDIGQVERSSSRQLDTNVAPQRARLFLDALRQVGRKSGQEWLDAFMGGGAQRRARNQRDGIHHVAQRAQ